MLPVKITVQYAHEGTKNSRVVRLSLDMVVSQAVDELIETLGLPREIDGVTKNYHLLRGRQALTQTQKLYEQGVQDGELLQLVAVDPNATIMGLGAVGNILSRMGGKSAGEPLALKASLRAVGAPQVFPLKSTRALIGRADPALGYPPESLDVDLTPLDPARTVSRPHALIVYANEAFTIRDLYSQLGVHINGTTIPTNQAHPLNSGDHVMIGEVSLIFVIDG